MGYVCPDVLTAEILMHVIRRDRLHWPVWVQVTDFDLHRMWVIPYMTGYFAANDEIALRMRAVGLAGASVHVVGIPIMPVFSQPLNREECARELGLDPQRRLLLLVGGGGGLGKREQVATPPPALDADSRRSYCA